MVTLVIWIAVCVAAFFVQTRSQFWGVALFAGLGIGSLQSAARSMVGLFAPTEKAGEFFGFWGFVGKAAFATGPFVFGMISQASGSQRLAILSTAAFFLLGLLAMIPVDSDAGRRAADEWDRRERRADSRAGA